MKTLLLFGFLCVLLAGAVVWKMFPDLFDRPERVVVKFDRVPTSSQPTEPRETAEKHAQTTDSDTVESVPVVEGPRGLKPAALLPSADLPASAALPSPAVETDGSNDVAHAVEPEAENAAKSTPVTWAGDAENVKALPRFRELRGIIADDPHNEAAIATALEIARENDWPNEARDLLARLVKLRPEDATLRFEFATQLMRLERWIEAISHLRGLTEQQPNDARAWYNLAIAHQSAGHLHDACRSWNRVIELMPENPDALAHRGEALLDLRDWEAAAADFETVLRWEPDSLDAAMNLSLALSKTGRLTEARDALLPLLTRRPRHIPLLNRLAKTTWLLYESDPGRYAPLAAEVRSYCERSLASAPDQPDIRDLLQRAPQTGD